MVTAIIILLLLCSGTCLIRYTKGIGKCAVYGLGVWCLMPLSTIFKLYRSGTDIPSFQTA